MTRQEWISELKIRLSIFSEEEIKKVLEYYDELYADMREQNYYEHEIISSFGNPYDVAKKIMADFETNFEQNCGGARVETEKFESKFRPEREVRGTRSYVSSNKIEDSVPFVSYGMGAENRKKDSANFSNRERFQSTPSANINNTYARNEQTKDNNLGNSTQSQKNTQMDYDSEPQRKHFNADNEKKSKKDDSNPNVDDIKQSEKLKKSAEKGVDSLRTFYRGLSRGFQVLFTIISAMLLFSFTITVLSVAFSVVVSFIAFGGGAVGSFGAAIFDAVTLGFSGNTLIAMGVSALMISLFIIAVPIAKFLFKWGFTVIRWCVAQIKYIWNKGDKTV